MARIREFNTEMVLDKAVLLFWKRGFNGVSTQELIDEFGISKSSLYGAFGDKLQLFMMSLERYRLGIIAKIIPRLDNCILVKNEIKKILTETSNDALSDKDQKGCFIVNCSIELAPHNGEIARVILTHRIRIEAAFTSALKRAIKSGEISSQKNPEKISRLICNAMSGIYVEAKYIRDKKYFAGLISAILETLE